MNTQLQTALAEAGVTIPLNKRVWTWLKDHPSKGSKETAKALNVAPSDVSATLSNMYQRGMVARAQRTNNNTVGPHTEYEYTALGRTFQLLPRPAGKHQPRPQVTPIPALAPVVTVASEPPKPTMLVNIDNMKVGEARALYTHLKAIFG